MNRKFFNCSCGSEILVCEKWEEDNYPFVGLCIFNYGADSRLSWKRRIRWCFNILKSGLPWCDQIVLDKDSTIKVGRYLLENNKNEI